ncbi:MAG: cardiolipin synthase ClsB [Betaproteobacteria bacterium HGW-Betaproteobacteria-11]|nr:MAG: cardiolipin synthase ClsB [Betaproteobacteria bacterium HGW-Betaproteobacteria-11]
MSADFFLPDNRVRLLVAGVEFFPALIVAIEAAAHEIHLETYIFADDAVARAIAAALARAAQRGVDVRLLVDGFGSRTFAAGSGQELAASGVELLVYRPELTRWRLRRHRLRRLHRKLAVIDGRTAFVGGINIIDDFDAGQRPAPRFDYAVQIEGPLAGEIHSAMRHLWRLVRWARLGRRPPPPAWTPPSRKPCGNTLAALVIRDNLGHRRDIENAYLDALVTAREEVIIANAFFLPGRRFREALLATARRGVRVSLVFQGLAEYKLMYYATQALYADFLAAGITIHEYRPAFLHAKVAVIDSLWATVGSSNIDPFSLLLAREANVVLRDPTFAEALRGSLVDAMARDCTTISPATQARRSWLLRLRNRAAYALVRLALGLSGHGARYTG